MGHLQGEIEEPTPSKLRIPSYQGSSSAENREESLEELITCPMTYYVRFFCGFDNWIIAHTVSTQHYKWYSGVVEVVDVAETTDEYWKGVI